MNWLGFVLIGVPILALAAVAGAANLWEWLRR
jgi:hypothetical protein